MSSEEKQFIKWVVILCILIALSVITSILVTVYTPINEQAIAPQEIAVKTTPRSIITDTQYAEKSYTLSVTVLPSDADNKQIAWTVAFENPNSGWANGKSVADYIKLTPSEDTSSCTVECLQAFGDAVIVTATSEMSPDVKAFTRCGYLQQSGTIGKSTILFGQCVLDFNMSKPVNTWQTNALGHIYDPYNPNNMMSASELLFSCEIADDGVGTAPDSFEYTYTFEATDALKTKMLAKGYTYSRVTGTLDNGSIVTDIPANFAFGCYFPLMGMDGLSDNITDMDFIMSLDTIIGEVLSDMDNTPFMTLTITATGSKGSYTQTTSFVLG